MMSVLVLFAPSESQRLNELVRICQIVTCLKTIGDRYITHYFYYLESLRNENMHNKIGMLLHLCSYRYWVNIFQNLQFTASRASLSRISLSVAHELKAQVGDETASKYVQDEDACAEWNVVLVVTLRRLHLLACGVRAGLPRVADERLAVQLVESHAHEGVLEAAPGR